MISHTCPYQESRPSPFPDFLYAQTQWHQRNIHSSHICCDTHARHMAECQAAASNVVGDCVVDDGDDNDHSFCSRQPQSATPPPLALRTDTERACVCAWAAVCHVRAAPCHSPIDTELSHLSARQRFCMHIHVYAHFFFFLNPKRL